MHVHLSVVIPAYNEASVLPETLTCLQNYLAQQPFVSEVIVVDDGSTDDTPRVLRQFLPRFESLRILRNVANRGKGASVRRGVLASCGKYVLFTDADLPARPEDIAKLLAPLDRGKAIAIASRLSFSDASTTTTLRLAASKLYRRLTRTILGLPVQDTQCGFKAFVRESALPIFDRLAQPGYSFDAELLFAAWLRGLSIQEVEIGLVERRECVRHAILLRAPQMLVDLFLIRFRSTGNCRVALAQTAQFLLGFSARLFPNAHAPSSSLP
jgi:dolichyl-phosphate beta-glucosyltransferase